MITINTPQDCCGCTACTSICAHKAITMQADKEGFNYPLVDADKCTNCGLCEKACPVINQREARAPQRTLAAINNDEATRLASSSGGLFTILAQQTLNEGGVVFGAAFNKEWEVEHIAIESPDELPRLQGSKYSQSNMGNSYNEAKIHLKAGRKVLFSGTPCQIAGLKRFLGREYENLTAIDMVCHGVPSPLVWKMYLAETIKNATPNNGEKPHIHSINFRDKKAGWSNYRFSIQATNPDYDEEKTEILSETRDKNTFMQCFLRNLCLRPSCHACPARSGKSGSDITLGDLWGASEVCPTLHDDKGTSLMLLWNNHTPTGGITYKDIEYSQAVKYNPSIEKNAALRPKRARFFRNLHKKGVYEATTAYTIGWKKRVSNAITSFIKNLLFR